MYARISIGDTGPGIEKENKERIFEPFFTTREKEMGMGIGLSLVKEIAGKHRGQIFVESEPGKGAIFQLYLPSGRAIPASLSYY